MLAHQLEAGKHRHLWLMWAIAAMIAVLSLTSIAAIFTRPSSPYQGVFYEQSTY